MIFAARLGSESGYGVPPSIIRTRPRTGRRVRGLRRFLRALALLGEQLDDVERRRNGATT